MQTVAVDSKADSSATSLVRAVLASAGDLAFAINLVEFEDRELDHLVLVVLLLGFGVSLLLSLLSTT